MLIGTLLNVLLYGVRLGSRNMAQGAYRSTGHGSAGDLRRFQVVTSLLDIRHHNRCLYTTKHTKSGRLSFCLW